MPISFILLQRVSRARMQSAVLAIVNASVRPSVRHRLSVCLSVCPSVTCWYCVKMTHATIMQFSMEDSPMTLYIYSFFTVNFTTRFQREPTCMEWGAE